jgi:Arc/MetJ-type ribon-helix-helix transcriptional regulator
MPRRRGTNTMELVSFHIQKQALEEIDELVKQGVFPSRSEAIRYAIRKLLAKELKRPINDDYPDEVFMMGR